MRHRKVGRARLALVLGAIALISGALFVLSGSALEKTGGVRKAQRSVVTLSASAETQPVAHGGDAADDPAIWIYPRRPASSTIIGTDKDGGLAVYDLSGRQLQYLADGEMNNVDLRPEFPLGSRRVALVAASNRSDDTIALYRVDERTRRLAPLASVKATISLYGLCMYRSRRTSAFHVFVSAKDGQIEQWQLVGSGGALRARRVRSFDVGGTVEGCAADDDLGRLYLAEEDQGIWRYSAEPTAGTGRTLVDSTAADGHLTADVEGLAIAYGARRAGWLIASSQGDSTFAVYRRAGGNEYVRTFQIATGNRIDEVTGTDGIDVTTAGLGAAFPNGLFVAQDDSNDGANQNFKLVRWRPPAPDRRR